MHRNRVGALLILSSLTVFSMISCNKKGNTKIYEYKDGKAVDTKKTINVKFYDIPHLPYVSVKDYLNTFVPDVYNVSYNNNVFTFTNKIWNKGSYKPNARFDANTQTITYDDWTCFTCIDSEAANPLDLVSGKSISVKDSTGKECFLFGNAESTYNPGKSVSIKVKDTYKITSYVDNGSLYMPIYTAKCLFTSNHIYSYFYNGDALYQQAGNDNSSYSSQIKQKLFTPTTDYLEYSYNQLALDLDLHYGMGGLTRKMRYNNSNKTYHTGLNDSSYGILNSYKNRMMKSAKNFDDVIEEIFAYELDDGGHTGILKKGYYSKIKASEDLIRGDELISSNKSYNNILNGRTEEEKDKYPDGTSYYAVENVSSPTFAVLRLENFDAEGLVALINLIRYINGFTTINRLIIDLSCNGGGYVFVQHYLNQYLSRGNATNYFSSSVNGSSASVKYEIDANLDGIFNSSKDKLPTRSNMTVDLICSNATFSAANATACYANAYNQANTTLNIYGENTGGGVCAVDSTMMTTLGTVSQFSSPYRLMYANSTNVDDGISQNKDYWNSRSSDSSVWNNYSHHYLQYNLYKRNV